MIQCALIERRGSPPVQTRTDVRSEDSGGTCDIIVGDCACLRMNVDDTGTRGANWIHVRAPAY